MKVFLDMDGVLADFVRGYREHVGICIKVMNKMYDDNVYPDRNHVWEKTRDGNFWKSLPKMPEADIIIETVFSHWHENDINILTAPVRCDPSCPTQKLEWVKAHTNIKPENFNAVHRSRKKEFACVGGKPNLLIDDHEKNIAEWREAGGIGIEHYDINKTLEQIKQIVGDNNAKRFLPEA